MCLFFAIGISFIWYQFLGGKRWIAYDFHGEYELPTFAQKTNPDSIYTEDEFRKVLSSYSFFEQYNIDEIIEDSIVVPGLKATYTLEDYRDGSAGPGICTSMTPQGVTVTENYVLVSAYCHTKKHNSVIYVIDRITHKFLKEIVLFDKSHVGSIAYDSMHHNIWVCCHDDLSHFAYVRAFTLGQLQDYSFEETGKPISYILNYPIKTQKRASFMTYYDEHLYVGYFSNKIDSRTTVQRFDVATNGELIVYPNMDKRELSEPDMTAFPSLKEYINGGMQGYARDEDKTLILRSGGSHNDSILMSFTNRPDDLGGVDLTDSQADSKEKLPPLAEEICITDNQIYICFESSAFAFRGRNAAHVDRILVLDKNNENCMDD